MIMQKIPGSPASETWDTLSTNLKGRVVAQIAKYIGAIFALRFDQIGSLYLPSPSQNKFIVGPIVNTPFYRALDGVVRIPDQETTPNELLHLRGPYENVTDYLQSSPLAELHYLSHHHTLAVRELEESSEEAPASRLEQGKMVLEKVVRLCSVYPGEHIVHRSISTPTKPVSLLLDDFRLSNIMINEDSGDITGIIDFEGATIVPLWQCALIPRWLQHPDDPEASYEGGSAEERQPLRAIFLENITNEEWHAAYENGRPFRILADRLMFQVGVWASDTSEQWVNERLAWSNDHSGVGFPEPLFAS